MKEIFSERLNKSNFVTKGDVLVASPFLGDYNFERSVVLLCEHRETDGTFGLICNKPSPVDLDNMEETEHLEDNLYFGGPVEQNTLHFIHTLPQIEDSIPIKDGLFWGGDYEQVKRLHSLGILTPSNCRFFLGYSGWSRGQLKQEIESESWIIARPNLQTLFTRAPTMLWQQILRDMGGKYRAMSHFPENAQLN